MGGPGFTDADGTQYGSGGAIGSGVTDVAGLTVSDSCGGAASSRRQLVARQTIRAAMGIVTFARIRIHRISSVLLRRANRRV